MFVHNVHDTMAALAMHKSTSESRHRELQFPLTMSAVIVLLLPQAISH